MIFSLNILNKYYKYVKIISSRLRGRSMEEKLNILLNQIKIDDLNKSSFNGGKIEQIKGNRSHDNYCFCS